MIDREYFSCGEIMEIIILVKYFSLGTDDEWITEDIVCLDKD